MNVHPKYKRIVLKLSGEALSGEKDLFDFSFISKVAAVLSKCKNAGVEIAVIVGGGNIWRGRSGGEMNRVRADNMGMLATAINALALQNTFLAEGLETVVMSATELPACTEYYTPRKAIEALQSGKIVIFACGLGVPFFSTDTPAAVRTAEIEADALLLAKNVDGLYTADPKLDQNAKLIEEITYREVLERNLKAFDQTAMSFCMENNINAYAFGLSDPDNIYKVVMGEKIGTEIHN